jgi:hypothetical protein
MKNLLKNYEGLIVALIGLSLMVWDYVDNGYKFDYYPNGIIVFSIGILIMFGKYFYKKSDSKD